MLHDQPVRDLATSRGFPEWARSIALAGLRSDPVDAARVFARLAKAFSDRAEAVRHQHAEEAGRWLA